MPREFVNSFNDSGPSDECQGPNKFFLSEDWDWMGSRGHPLDQTFSLVCGVVWRVHQDCHGENKLARQGDPGRKPWGISSEAGSQGIVA